MNISHLLINSRPRAGSYILVAAAACALALALTVATPRRDAHAAPSATAQQSQRGPFFLPHGEATKTVTVTKTGNAEAGVTILTEAVAVKETGPKAAVAKFGEVYAFSPTFIAVHRDQPTEITFWNLQPDDEHDFALVGPDLKVLMYVKLDPLAKTTYIFTFHKEGAIDFKCLRHQPEMSGQFLVLPPEHVPALQTSLPRARRDLALLCPKTFAHATDTDFADGKEVLERRCLSEFEARPSADQWAACRAAPGLCEDEAK